MTKQSLIDKFEDHHQAMIDYVSALPDDAFTYSNHGKWTAGQQLSHLFLCLKPIAQALVSKDFIRQTFGEIDRPALTNDQVIDRYKDALDNGGKAPDRFVPEQVATGSSASLADGLSAILQTIRQLLDGYMEEELDTLVLPHPLLGKMTIRELLYLMTYHATHHHRQTEQNLEGFTGR